MGKTEVLGEADIVALLTFFVKRKKRLFGPKDTERGDRREVTGPVR